MSDDSQILIPASFALLYRSRSGRLSLDARALGARYDLCEDLASALTAHAQQLYHGGAASEQGVLAAIHDALRAPGSSVSADEARWVVLRLAELLCWRSPQLPEREC